MDFLLLMQNIASQILLSPELGLKAVKFRSTSSIRHWPSPNGCELHVTGEFRSHWLSESRKINTRCKDDKEKKKINTS